MVCLAWDSNQGLQDGWRRRNHWAMAAAIHQYEIVTGDFYESKFGPKPIWMDH